MGPESLIAGGILLVSLIIFLVMFILGICIFSFVFWILMIIDCAKRDFRDESTKVVWIVVLVLLGIIAAIVYYFVVKRPEDSKKKAKK